MSSQAFKTRFGSMLVFGAVGFAMATLITPGRTGASDPQSRPATLTSRVVTWQDARPHKGGWGEMRAHFSGETFATRDAFAAIAVVEPGKAAHSAHRHAEEEYLFITEGSGMWHLAGREFPARKGDVLYVEPWIFHGLRNTGEKPLTFVVVKYNAKGVPVPARPDHGRDEMPNP